MRAIVCGAGIAGLTAAWQLHRAGARVTVFEATAHLGGLELTAATALPQYVEVFVEVSHPGRGWLRTSGIRYPHERKSPMNRTAALISAAALMAAPVAVTTPASAPVSPDAAGTRAKRK